MHTCGSSLTHIDNCGSTVRALRKAEENSVPLIPSQRKNNA